MTFIGTQTKTFTVADIRKVVDRFAADYVMISQSTGLYANVAEDVSDLKNFAEYSYLVKVTLYLLDKNGNKLKVAVYRPSENALGWNSDRPGGNLWPRTPDGTLCIIATFTDSWWQKTEEEKATFINNKGLNAPWSKTKMDTSLVGLSSSSGQKYSSNGYGWERTNYSI